MASQTQTTLDEKFLELLKAKETQQNSSVKIQKVAPYLRNRKKFDKHYSPMLVSIGPIHHGNPDLKLGENYKLTWAAKYMENIQQIPRDLHKKITDKINELKGLFADDVLALVETAESLKGFGDLEEKLSWLLFVDGCSLLYILMNVNLLDRLDKPQDVNIKVDQVVLVMMDVLLLENQLPYLVLKLLWKNDEENELIFAMDSFLQCHPWYTPDTKWSRNWQGILQNNTKQEQEHEVESPNVSVPPIHLLDLQRNIILTKTNPKIEGKSLEEHSTMTTFRNIQDLRAAGIRLKSSKTRRPRDVDFSEGWFAELTLPEIVVDETAASTFLNLTAYEMCSDFANDYGICSFVVLMDSLIEHPEDAKELRFSGILVHSLGSDEEVAEFFNTISTDLVLNPDTYYEVQAKIHRHYRKKGIKLKVWIKLKLKRWIAQGYQTYLRNPWTIIGCLAGFIALALTSLQTWFTIFPRS